VVSAGLLLISHCTFGADSVEIFAKASALTMGPNDERAVIKITFRVGGKDREEIALVSEGEPFNPSSYTLTDESKEQIPVTPVIPKDIQELRLISSVMLLPAKAIKRESQYTLTVKEGTFVFETVSDNVTNHVPNTLAALNIKGESVSNVLDYVEKRQVGKSKVEIGAGTPGGVASIELVYDQSQFLHVDWMNLRVKGNADLTLNEADRGNYFNNVTGEGMFYKSLRPTGNYMELSLGGKVEADQTFDLANAGFNARWAWFVKNGLTDRIGHVFVKDSVNVPPLMIISYDFLENIRQTNSATANDDPRHRVTALVRYQLPISRDLDLSALPTLGGKYDLSVDFEIKGTYDSASEKIQDQSWISVVFERSAGLDRFKPAFTLTWARGKSAPRFEQVSALFAGFRLIF